MNTQEQPRKHEGFDSGAGRRGSSTIDCSSLTSEVSTLVLPFLAPVLNRLSGDELSRLPTSDFVTLDVL
jgi:hypothetical protein